jgi:hypothetical protein
VGAVRRFGGFYLTEAADGGFRLTNYDADVQREMAAAGAIMRDDREIVHALALVLHEAGGFGGTGTVHPTLSWL